MAAIVPLMGDVYLPAGWPEAVTSPGSQDWEASAVAFPVKFICSETRLRPPCVKRFGLMCQAPLLCLLVSTGRRTPITTRRRLRPDSELCAS